MAEFDEYRILVETVSGNSWEHERTVPTLHAAMIRANRSWAHARDVAATCELDSDREAVMPQSIWISTRGAPVALTVSGHLWEVLS
jgi:hypothetical protein